jgi:sugar lactone lactonase YvrE
MARPWRAVIAVLSIAAPLLHVAPASADESAYAWTAIVVQQPPATMHPGQIVALSVALRNEGTEPWLGEAAGPSPFRLGTVAPRDRVSAFALEDPTWLWSGGRRIRMTSPVVPSGGIGTFTFTFRAPSDAPSPTSYVERFAPLLEGGPWLDDDVITLTTTVVRTSGAIPAIPSPPPVPSPPPTPSPEPTVPPLPTPTPVPGYAWEPVAVQPAPAAMHPGLKVVLSVVLRNTGTETWSAEESSVTPMRLAAVNALGSEPRERSSAFGREDPTWLWSAGRRIRMATPHVAPGGVGTFTFTFTAPAAATYPQNHVERFAPVVEGVALLDDRVITITTQVRPAAAPLPPIPEAPAIPSPDPLPTLPPVPSPDPLPTLPPVPGTTCPTSATPRPEDLIPPAVALGYAPAGTALAGAASAPSAVAYGFAKMFAADPVNDRIVKSDPAGFAVETFGTSGTGPGEMRSPSGVAISDSALVFVSDTGNDRIQVWGFAGVFVSQFGGTGSEPGRFRDPRGITVIPNGPFAGNLAVADTGNDRIQVVSRTGVPLAVIGGPGEGPGMFSSPSSVSVWGSSMFVADTGNERIQRLALDGTFEGAWGGPGAAGGCTAVPTGVLATAHGVFVAEAGSGRVERFTRWGAWLETFGTVQAPSGLAVDPSARIYVSESGADRIARFSPIAAAAPPIPG